MPATTLSDLQQFILALAHFHRTYWFRDEGTHPHCYAYEVLAVRWGFPTQDGWPLEVWERRTPERPLLAKARYGARYQAARVAVSKAFCRLEQRRLVRRGSYRDATGQSALGLVLTPAGIPLARQALSTRFKWHEAYEALWAQGKIATPRERAALRCQGL